MDVDILIGEVQKRPILWDVSNEEYKNRIKKNEAWIQICEVLFEDFNIQVDAIQKIKSKYELILHLISLV